MHDICCVNLPRSAAARLRKVSLQLPHLSVFSLIKRFFRDALNLFWKYVTEKEYDFHPQIPNSIFDVLKRYGWYKGRKINIDSLIEECMDDDIFLTELSIPCTGASCTYILLKIDSNRLIFEKCLIDNLQYNLL